jgi:hypothetical protein
VKEQPTSKRAINSEHSESIKDTLKDIDDGWLSPWKLSDLMPKYEIWDDTNAATAFHAYLIKVTSKDIGESVIHVRELLKDGDQ